MHENDTSSKPTREELLALLFSDPASDAYEHDALSLLTDEIADDGDKIGGGRLQAALAAVQRLIDVVGAETGDVVMSLDGENAREDLKSLACGAKRCAILLLHAAYTAERALKPRARQKPPESPQLSLVSTGPARKRSREVTR